MIWPDAGLLEGVTDHQRAQVARATSGPVGLFHGGPGTGKTFSIASLIQASFRQNELFRAFADQKKESSGVLDERVGEIELVAPTGKAAQRMNQSLQQHAERFGAPELLSFQARTIHNLLGPTRNGHDGEGWGFAYGLHNKLPCRFLFLDEGSMLDTTLGAHVITACNPGTNIIIVGDPSQLPPVGHGKPFADMISSGLLPVGHLTEIHRYAGRIAAVCDAIKHKQVWQPSPAIDLSAEFPENLRVIETANASLSMDMIKTCVAKAKARGYRNDQIQVICPVNEKSELSRKELNRELRELLREPQVQGANQGEPVPENSRILPGDRVICGKNMLPQEFIGFALKKGGGKQIAEGPCRFVANGETGVAIGVHEKLLIVSLDAGRNVVIKGDQRDEWDLAYGITCHKSQGSQWPVVIVVADSYPGANMVCSQAWWYTAISRASDYCVVVGKRDVIDRHCRMPGIEARRTLLVRRMERLMQRKETN